MIYVVARNARIAEMVARGRVERKIDYLYVHEPFGIKGVIDAEVYVYSGGKGPYPHDVMEEVHRREMSFPGRFNVHYVEESELQP